MAEAMATIEDILTEAAEVVAVTTEADTDTCLEVATRLTLGTISILIKFVKQGCVECTA